MRAAGGDRVTPFRDRTDAGRRLAVAAGHLTRDRRLLVLALPRGGVPVAAEVAAALRAPLDVYLVRKLGVPDQPELAMGAIASGGVRVINDRVVQAARVSRAELDEVIRAESRELERREVVLRGERSTPTIAGRAIVLVDDGIATGSTMRAAISALRALDARSIVVAVPVAAPESVRELASEVEEVVCVATPDPFRAISLWYDDFSQTTDDEVRAIVSGASSAGPSDQ
jgi:predicted phosphoribosyltransferase